jgi:hypothetical protein
MQQVETRPISDTHYLIIDCGPGKPRPNQILHMILTDNSNKLTEEDTLTENDLSLIYSNFGEWKYGVYKDKETIFELNLSKILPHLTSLYNSRIIRYAEWYPK